MVDSYLGVGGVIGGGYYLIVFIYLCLSVLFSHVLAVF